MEIPNDVIIFETPDGTEKVELREDPLIYDSERGVWKIPDEKFESEESIKYRKIPHHRVYEVKQSESAPEHMF